MMRLILLTCSCHNTENLTRQLLRRCGDPKYLGRPVHHGKHPSLQAIRGLQNPAVTAPLEQYIQHHSRFSIALLYNDDPCDAIFEWRDFGTGTTKNKLEAEALVIRAIEAGI